MSLSSYETVRNVQERSVMHAVKVMPGRPDAERMVLCKRGLN